MVRKGLFPEEMKWKEGSGGDLKPDPDISSLDTENLELVKLILLSTVKSVHLEQAGLWTRLSEPSIGEDSGLVSRAGTGIFECIILK